MFSSEEVPPTAAPGRRLVQHFPFLALFADSERGWLYADWRGPQTLATLQAGTEAVLAAIATGAYSKLLNDNTHLTEIQAEFQEWPDPYELMPLFRAGLHCLAWVYSPNAQGRAFADFYVTRSNWPLILTFEECEVAAEWLRSC